MAHLFYPSHDIALGNGVKHFNPPFAARKLEEDLCDLSKIWNDFHEKQLNSASKIPIPWGWNYDTRELLHKEYKIPYENLPTDTDLIKLRELSSRKTTIEILKKLKEGTDAFEKIDLPLYIDSEEALNEIIESRKDFVLKTPWSSSGRGLSRSTTNNPETLRKHGVATIRKMGGIMAERWYEKAQDFAMLFYVGKNGVSLLGYSLFENDENNTYRCGKLCSNQKIREIISDVFDAEDLENKVLSILNEMFLPFFGKSWEVGFVGIDIMLVWEKEDVENLPTCRILHPCVEMNLRCTMGVVARLYFEKNCETEETGEFRITPAMEHEQLVLLDKQLLHQYGEKYHRLSTLLPDSIFMAYIILSL